MLLFCLVSCHLMDSTNSVLGFGCCQPDMNNVNSGYLPWHSYGSSIRQRTVEVSQWNNYTLLLYCQCKNCFSRKLPQLKSVNKVYPNFHYSKIMFCFIKKDLLQAILSSVKYDMMLECKKKELALLKYRSILKIGEYNGTEEKTCG